MMTQRTIIPFDLTHTFECGQCFRWNQNEDGSYTGVAQGRVLTISQENNCFSFDQDIAPWETYFDLSTDYLAIQQQLCKDNPVMETVIPHGSGIRILKQDLFETIISFLISQNNNIPRIKQIIEKLCSAFGDPILHNGKVYHAFPSPQTLAALKLEDLAFLKAGYRDRYLLDAAVKMAQGSIDVDILLHGPIDNARQELYKIKGVGPKVADCILLFGAGRTSVFPTDVWMKKVLSGTYQLEHLSPKEINLFAQTHFHELAGYAQQYLFYHARSTQFH